MPLKLISKGTPAAHKQDHPFRKGPKGGFALLKKQNEITLLDVYEAVEGQMEIEAAYE